jgi:hypothetical protein
MSSVDVAGGLCKVVDLIAVAETAGDEPAPTVTGETHADFGVRLRGFFFFGV